MDLLHRIIGPHSDAITWWQMSIRGAVVFLFAVALVRLGHRRAFGHNTTLDLVLTVVLGSTLSRAITGNAPFVPTLAAAGTLVAVHAVMAWGTWRWPALARLVKGRPVRLVSEGRADERIAARTRITEEDLDEAARLHGVRDAAEVDAMYLERSGDVSVVQGG